MSLISSIKSIFFSSNKENIKDVLEDIIEDNGNSVESIDDGTKKIFKNIIQLNDKCIEDVMIPRADIDAVSSSIKINQLITFINKTKHSRIPVYDENLDKVIGMVHIRDLFDDRFEASVLSFLHGSARQLHLVTFFGQMRNDRSCSATFANLLRDLRPYHSNCVHTCLSCR